MSRNHYPPTRSSRADKHSKRRKTNIILNILIGIVFVLILIVGGSILLDSDKKEQAAGKVDQEPKENIVDDDNGLSSEPNDKDEQANNQEKVDTGDESNTEDPESDANSHPNESGEVSENMEVNDNSNDPNVVKTFVNPSWQPAGTSQTGEHVTNYSKGSVDRMEMEQALAYAASLEPDNMIVWWLENGGEPNKNVIGTITTKDQSEVYRVHLDWIDGEGWKPSKLQILHKNDKKR